MTGKDGRHLAALFGPQTPGGDTGSQHDRLGIHGLGQRFSRTFGNHLPQIITQGTGGFIKSGTNYGRIAIGCHHANALRALAGKYESKRHCPVS